MGNDSDGFDSRPNVSKLLKALAEVKSVLHTALIHFGAGVAALPFGSRLCTETHHQYSQVKNP